MSDTQPVNTVDDAIAQAKTAINALRHAPPGESADSARKRNNELIRRQRELIEVSQRVADLAAKQVRTLTKDKNRKPASRQLVINAAAMVLAKARKQMAELVGTMAAETELRCKQQIAELEARIASLEARPPLQYDGTWNETKAYNAGSFVTHQGGLWHCSDTNVGVRPGTSPAWKLAVKRGKDGRDAR